MGYAFDDVAPFIVINDKDGKAAWSLTLLHEFTHLVLGKTGFSGDHSEQEIEPFCDDVASEIILPASDLKSLDIGNAEFEELKHIISDYADSMNVSSSHVAYRLHKRRDIAIHVWLKLNAFFTEQWLSQRNRQKEINRDSKKDSGPSNYVSKKHSLGTTLVDAVQRFTQSRTLSTTKAGTLLGVRPLKIHMLFTGNSF